MKWNENRNEKIKNVNVPNIIPLTNPCLINVRVAIKKAFCVAILYSLIIFVHAFKLNTVFIPDTVEYAIEPAFEYACAERSDFVWFNLTTFIAKNAIIGQKLNTTNATRHSAYNAYTTPPTPSTVNVNT